MSTRMDSLKKRLANAEAAKKKSDTRGAQVESLIDALRDKKWELKRAHQAAENIGDQTIKERTETYEDEIDRIYSEIADLKAKARELELQIPWEETLQAEDEERIGIKNAYDKDVRNIIDSSVSELPKKEVSEVFEVLIGAIDELSDDELSSLEGALENNDIPGVEAIYREYFGRKEVDRFNDLLVNFKQEISKGLPDLKEKAKEVERRIIIQTETKLDNYEEDLNMLTEEDMKELKLPSSDLEGSIITIKSHIAALERQYIFNDLPSDDKSAVNLYEVKEVQMFKLTEDEEIQAIIDEIRDGRLDAEDGRRHLWKIVQDVEDTVRNRQARDQQVVGRKTELFERFEQLIAKKKEQEKKEQETDRAVEEFHEFCRNTMESLATYGNMKQKEFSAMSTEYLDLYKQLKDRNDAIADLDHTHEDAMHNIEFSLWPVGRKKRKERVESEYRRAKAQKENQAKTIRSSIKRACDSMKKTQADILEMTFRAIEELKRSKWNLENNHHEVSDRTDTVYHTTLNELILKKQDMERILAPGGLYSGKLGEHPERFELYT